MPTEDLDTGSKSDLFKAPNLALKQALCYSCWDVSSNLSRCSSCKRVSYCSKECQKHDWNKDHKKICEKLVALNKEKNCIPTTGRRWNDYYDEQALALTGSGTENPSELERLVAYEPYCYRCYRRESQLGDGEKLNGCQRCHLTSFCPSCEQTHPSAECAILQDIVADDKILIDLRRRTGSSTTLLFSKLPRKQYIPLSSAQDWYEYCTSLLDMGGLRLKMNRDLRYLAEDPKDRQYVDYLRCGTNMTTIQLTLIAALEAAIPNVSTCGSINIHLIGVCADGDELASLPAFEELLHFLPSLKALNLVFVGPNLFESVERLQCCAVCTKMERRISITTWKGPYQAYTDTKFYKPPDLAAAFQSGFALDEKADWFPTTKYLAHAPHPTLFTAGRYPEIKEEMAIWKNLGAEFVKDAEVNRWKGMSPWLGACGVEPNEVTYQNYWWYILKQR